MNWDYFFADLEGQLADELSAEQASLATESERLRIAQLDLATRLRSAAVDGGRIRLSVRGGQSIDGSLVAVGADWCSVSSGVEHLCFVSLAQVTAIRLAQAAMARSLLTVPATSLADRMTFGFMMRDLTRRRAFVEIGLDDGGAVAGTIDRACADHLDLAVHDRGTARRHAEVRDEVMLTYSAIVSVTYAHVAA